MSAAANSILDFFRQRVHMHGTTAKGISVRVRFKVTAPTAEYLAKLPPIEGLPDPPIKPPEKPSSLRSSAPKLREETGAVRKR